MSHSIKGIRAAGLAYGKAQREAVECTSANTDYPCSTAPPQWAKYLSIYTDYHATVAMGVATSATVGLDIAAGSITIPVFPHSSTDAYNLPHVQSVQAGAVVVFTWLDDVDS